MINKIPKELLEIYKQFDNCKRCNKLNNPLRHILGGGKFRNPKFFFLFINPTHLNISAHKTYQGKRRYPFIGVRYFFKRLSEAGFLDKGVVDGIYKRGWQIEDEDRIEKSLCKNDVYITDLIKCSQFHPNSPKKEIIKEDFPIFQKEIDIVSPKYIVTFGKIPFEVLANQNIRFKDYLKRIRDNTYQPIKSIDILGKKYDILPCYFPVGRGNPNEALEILRYIKKKIN